MYYSLVIPEKITSFLDHLSFHIHVHSNKELHEWTFAVDWYPWAPDDPDEFFLIIDSAANGVSTWIITKSASHQKISDHQEIS